VEEGPEGPPAAPMHGGTMKGRVPGQLRAHTQLQLSG
jgi:hypothetical protein